MLPERDLPAYLASFDRIVGTIAGGEDGFAAIRRMLSDDPDMLNDPRRADKRQREELGNSEWRWPWLEHWRERFAAMGALPALWQPPYGDSVALLFHTILFAMQREYKWGLVRFWPGPAEPWPVQEMIEAKIAAYAAGREPPELPPFFPGDRTMVRSHMPIRSKRVADTVTICAFRGYGEGPGRA